MANQAKPSNLLDRVTPEERQELLDLIEKRERDSKPVDDGVTPEMYALVEFGYYFGWEGIMAVENNQISLTDMYLLTAAAEKVRLKHAIDNSFGNLIAHSASRSSNPKAFSEGIKSIVKRAEVFTDE